VSSGKPAPDGSKSPAACDAGHQQEVDAVEKALVIIDES
jgi:hypothetical protein